MMNLGKNKSDSSVISYIRIVIHTPKVVKRDLRCIFCLDIHYTATDQSSAEFSAEVRQTDRDLTKRYPAITLSDSESYSAYLIRVRGYNAHICHISDYIQW